MVRTRMNLTSPAKHTAVPAPCMFRRARYPAMLSQALHRIRRRSLTLFFYVTDDEPGERRKHMGHTHGITNIDSHLRNGGLYLIRTCVSSPSLVCSIHQYILQRTGVYDNVQFGNPPPVPHHYPYLTLPRPSGPRNRYH